MKKKWFTWRETEVDNCFTRLIIVPLDYDAFPMNIKNGGSYNVAPARVLGLTYAEYLRFAREMFPEVVTIEGKGNYFPLLYWKRGAELNLFIKLLDARLNLALTEMDYDDDRKTKN